MVPGPPKWAKKAFLRQFFAVAKQAEDQGLQTFFLSFLGLIISSKPNLCFMGRLGMVPGPLKWAKKGLLKGSYSQ